MLGPSRPPRWTQAQPPAPGPHRDHMEDATRMALVRQVRQVSGGQGQWPDRRTDGTSQLHPAGLLQGKNEGIKPHVEARETGMKQTWCGLLAGATWDRATLAPRVRVAQRGSEAD